MEYTTRKFAAILAAIFIGIMVLFPPMQTPALTRKGVREVFVGYQFIGSLESNQTSTKMAPLLGNDDQGSISIYSIETKRLYAQIVSVLAISILLMSVFDDK